VALTSIGQTDEKELLLFLNSDQELIFDIIETAKGGPIRWSRYNQFSFRRIK